MPRHPAGKRPHPARRAFLQLLGLGTLLEALLLALYPLLAGATPKNDAAKQALIGLFPWLPRLYWTTTFPAVAQILSHVPIFDPSNGGSNTGGGNANLLLVLLALAFVIMLIASRTGSRVVRERLSRTGIRVLFTTITILTLIFSITCFFAPPVMSQGIFLYGLYGRLVTVYHVNPFVASLSAYPHDLLQNGIAKGIPFPGLTTSGPVWIDLSIPVVLLARNSVANIMLGFRSIGLAAHLIDTVLVWVVLAKLKPETRVSATLLYGWNPLVLLLSISGMHQETVIVLFILLAIIFFQRKSPILGWVLMLLAMLINMLFLLLLPLFFRLLGKEARTLRLGRRILWWLAVTAISGVVVVLAYAPYWQSWGTTGLLTSMRQTFLQANAINSLDAALLTLPLRLPPALSWLIVPGHWIIFAAITVGVLLLLGTWLSDNVELVVVFSSWVSLALLIFMPAYWPWFAILPLVLALCSTSRRTILLAMLLAVGALGSYYFWLWQPPWSGQALVTVGLPLLLWGWILFFTSTWEMTHANEQPLEPAVQPQSRRGLSRPSWPRRRM